MRSFTACFSLPIMSSLLLSLLVGCTLTSTEVEPDLPDGRANDSDTLVCHVDGLPVVANNYTDLGTIIVGILLDPRQVVGKVDYAGTLTIRGIDAPVGTKSHTIRLSLPKFQGLGTYVLQAPATYYQEYVKPATTSGSGTTLTFTLVPTVPAQVTITGWDTATRHLQGTFLFTVATAATAPNVVITDGRFDLTVDK